MACYYPLRAYRGHINPKTGKRAIVFNIQDGYRDMPIDLPCGRCIGCRLERSRQWAIRCVHEAQMHEDNCFITLTYENEPEGGTLVFKDFQDFMKRLRSRNNGTNIRYYHCGEYGSKNDRPHYHACIFGYNFPDRVHALTRMGNKLYTSELLDEIWGNGRTLIGEVTFESAAYVARYIMKKIMGKEAEGYNKYDVINFDTGEVEYERSPEYTTMSRRPGIGKEWFEKYKDDVYPDDFIVTISGKGKARKVRPPKYYDKIFDLEDPKELEKMKRKRKRLAKERELDNTEERLATRCKSAEIKVKKLIRSLENE